MKTICFSASVRLLVLVAFIGGCAVNEPTKQSLYTYTAAMEQVQQATDRFLVEYAAVDKLKKELEAATADEDEPIVLYPATFDPDEALSSSAEGVARDIQARRDALRMISDFNAALIALAEGRPTEEIRGQLTSFGSGIGSVLTSLGGATVPGLSEIIPLASRVAELIQNAQNKEQFEKALKEGQPVINAILDLLEDDTERYYAASVVVTNNDRNKPNVDIRTAGFAIIRLTAEHSEPTDAEVKANVRNLKLDLSAIGKQTSTRNLLDTVFDFKEGKPAYGERTHRQVLTQIQAINEAAKVDAGIVSRQNAYYDYMRAYVASVRQTKSSLEITVQKLNEPASIEAQAGRLLNIALELKQAYYEYKVAQ